MGNIWGIMGNNAREHVLRTHVFTEAISKSGGGGEEIGIGIAGTHGEHSTNERGNIHRNTRV